MSTVTRGLSAPEPGSGAVVDHYLPRLLSWLWEEADGQAGVPVSCTGFAEMQVVGADVVRTVADRLSRDGVLCLHGDEGEYPSVSFRREGVQAARRLVRRRADPIERMLYARRTLLNWALAPSEGQPRDVVDFFDTREVYFLGEPLTEGEVADALVYLQKCKLLSCRGQLLDERVGSWVELTAQGVDAVLSGADIGDFVNRLREQDRPSVGVTIHGNVYDSIVASDIRGDLTFQRPLRPEMLVQLVREMTPVLAPDSERRQTELREAAEALAAAEGLSEGRPAESSRSLFETLRNALEVSPDTLGKQVLLQAVGQLMATLLP